MKKSKDKSKTKAKVLKCLKLILAIHISLGLVSPLRALIVKFFLCGLRFQKRPNWFLRVSCNWRKNIKKSNIFIFALKTVNIPKYYEITIFF